MRCWILTVALLALTARSSTALGYQTDFHYGLTYWLARQAGFEHNHAHEIARGNERADTGVLDAKHAIMWRVCIGRWVGSTDDLETTSEETRKLHFRSQAPVPRAPNKRPVKPEAPFADESAKAVLAAVNAEPQDRLYRFGQALHGVQDAYSHQGVPGSVFGCPDDWMWAHPATRGGPVSTEADQTFRYPGDCDSAAARTYELLREYRRSLRHRTGPEWNALESSVNEFCRVASKADKAAWFVKHNVWQAPSIVKLITLKKGKEGKVSLRGAPIINLQSTMGSALPERRADPFQSKLLDAVYAQIAKGELPRGAEAWFQEFFSTWMSTDPRELNTVVRKFVNPQSQVWQRTDDQQNAVDFLLAWRIDGHGLSDPSQFRAAAWLQSGLEADGVIQSERDWRRAFVLERRGAKPFLLGVQADSQRNAVVAIVILQHAPYDVLVFVAEPHGDRFLITRLDSIAFH